MPSSPGSLSAASMLPSARGRRLVAAERHVLAAELEVEEARRACGGRPRPRRPGRGTRRAPLASAPASSSSGVGGDERRLLARVADGVGVGEVVRRDVEAALLREQAAQRRLEAHEARDRVMPSGPGRGGAARRPVQRRRSRPAGGSRGCSSAPNEADEVVEEGELLAHERAVDDVLALDLGEQAAQLGGALAGEPAPRPASSARRARRA